MTHYDSHERILITLALLPLLAASVWLIALRRPTPLAVRLGANWPNDRAYANERATSPAESPLLGVIVAGHEADLAADLTGQVVHVLVEPGARVRRGDPLLQLKAIAVSGTAGMAYAQGAEQSAAERAATFALESAHDKVARMEQAPSAYAERDLRLARTDAKYAEAELERLRANGAVRRATSRRELARAKTQTLRAPFDGVLARRIVDVGDFVAPGAALARVVDDKRFVRFAVPPAQLQALQVGMQVRVGGRGGVSSWPARLTNLEPELDAAAGFGFARAELNRDAALAFPCGARVDVLTAQSSARGSLR